MYYDIGIVLYTPSMSRVMEDPYELGDMVPIVNYFAALHYERQIIWMENTIKGLKVGDPIIFSLVHYTMFPIKVIEGLGVRAIGLDF